MLLVAIYIVISTNQNISNMRYNKHMDEKDLIKVRNYLKLKPYLVWSTKNYEDLSPDFIVESILNYGDWNDFLFIKDLFGIKNLSQIFENISKKRRVNLRPQTINYFKMFFSKYA
jgi:hypothetical protein